MNAKIILMLVGNIAYASRFFYWGIVFCCALSCVGNGNRNSENGEFAGDSIYVADAEYRLKKVVDTCRLGHLESSSINPGVILIEAVRSRDADLLMNNVSKDFYRSYEDFQSNEELFEEYWKVYNRGSSFWTLLELLIAHGGFYKDDSTYVMPVYASMIDTFFYECDNKLIAVTEGYIYAEPSFTSRKIRTMNMHEVLACAPQETNYVKCDEKYEHLGFPVVTEFDSDVWYFVPKYRGYVNGTDVWAFGSTNFYIKNRKGHWMLSWRTVND